MTTHKDKMPDGFDPEADANDLLEKLQEELSNSTTDAERREIERDIQQVRDNLKTYRQMAKTAEEMESFYKIHADAIAGLYGRNTEKRDVFIEALSVDACKMILETPAPQGIKRSPCY